MKQAKKLLALVMVLAMVMSLGITAFAAEAAEEAPTMQTISFKTDDDHSYDIYQIFTGKIEDGVLVNIEYGKNADGEGEVPYEKLEKLQDLNGEGHKAIEEAVQAYLNEEAAFATRTSEASIQVPTGYYYIVDKGNGDAQAPVSAVIIKVADNFEIAPKRPGTPTSEKKVKDINDSETTEYTDWQDSADHDIGDMVPFQITVTIPEGIEKYDFYKMNVKDTQSKGLTLKEDTFKIMMGEEELVKDTNWTLSVTNKPAAEGETHGVTEFTIAFADVKSFAKGGETIVITYESELNEDAVIGSLGNPNEMYLEYSRNPENSDDFGTTPVDKVIVFTYKTVVNKIDNEKKSLTGAGFTLYKKLADKTEKAIEYVEIEDENTTVFTFKGLDDGDYVLRETKVPTGYNKADDIEFTISATHDKEATDPKLLTFSGDATSGNAEFTSDITTGTVSTDVVNNKGVELPSTGGIGTTIFYVVGSMMMLAAAVLLITRKKMSAYQD